MVASRQVDIPLYRGIGWQSRRGFGALAQVNKWSAQFLRKNSFLTAKRVVALLLEFAVPEDAEVVSVRKNFKSAAKSAGGQTLRK